MKTASIASRLSAEDPPSRSSPMSSTAAREEPVGSERRYCSLSLAAIARIVSFFPNGVPLAFIASNPIARLAAETYRAEENYRWSTEGLIRREPGERETFDTYEARRQRRAGVAVGRLITVYHDCVGRLRRCTEPRLSPVAPVKVEEAVEWWKDERRTTGGSGVGLLAEEWHAKPLVLTPGVERETEEVREPVAPSGGDLLQADLTSHKAEETAVVLENGHRVYYFTGPNRRSLYLWLDTPVRRGPTIQLSAEEERMLHTEQDELLDQTLGLHDGSHEEEVKELLAKTRWWLQRPTVSSMKYLREVYGKDSTLLPPPPPPLDLHVYGQSASLIPLVCEMYLTPPAETLQNQMRSPRDMGSLPCAPHGIAEELKGVPSPLPSHAVALQELKNQQLENVFGAKKSTWLSTNAAMLAGAPQGNSLATPQTAPPSQAWVAEQQARHTLQHVTMPVLEGLTVIGYPLMSMQLHSCSEAEKSDDSHAPSSSTPAWFSAGHLDEDWLEACQLGGGGGLGLQHQERAGQGERESSAPSSGRPPIGSTRPPSPSSYAVSHTLRHSCSRVPAVLQREWVSRLRLLKFHGVRFDDNGLRTFIGSYLPPLPAVSSGSKNKWGNGDSGRSGSERDLESNDTPKSVGRALPTLRGGQTYKVAISPLMPFLEVCDLAMHLELTVFPLLSKEGTSQEDNVVYSGIRLLPVVPLRHLTLLQLQGTGIQQAVLDLIGLSCPALQSLFIGSCPFIRNVEPLGLLPVLRQLDLHSTSLTDEGIYAFMAPWGFPCLEELSIAGCMAIHNVSSIGHLKKLRKLDVRFAPIREGLTELRNCPRLEELHFSSSLRLAAQMRHRQPEWRHPAFLNHFHTLTVLVLDAVPLFNRDGIAAIVKARTGLRRLVLLHMNRLDSVEELARIPSLEYLHIEDAPMFMEDGLTGLGVHCPRLHTVLLHDCPLLDSIKGLAGARQLTHLEFLRNSQEVNELALTELFTPPPVKPFEITSSQSTSVKSFPSDTHSRCSVQTSVARIVERDASDGSDVSLPSLQVLRFPGYGLVQSMEPLAVAKGLLSVLTILDLSYTAVSNKSIEQLATTTDHAVLEALYLRGCAQVSKANALMHLPHLRLLDLSSTATSDCGIGGLKAAPALDTLLLDDCQCMQFMPHNDFFPHLRVLSMQKNPQLHTRKLKQFFSFANDAEQKLLNPLETPFQVLEELHLADTAVDSVQPLVMQKRLRCLDLSRTALTSDGLRHLSELTRLSRLSVAGIEKSLLGGSLRPLFTHRSLRTLDLCETALDPERPDAVQLPLAVLATSPLQELHVSGRSQLPLLLPLLLQPRALPALRLLVVRDSDVLTADAAANAASAALPPDVAALALPDGSPLKNEAVLRHREQNAVAERRRLGKGDGPIVRSGRRATRTTVDITHSNSSSTGASDPALMQSVGDRGKVVPPASLPEETLEVQLHRLQTAIEAISAVRPNTSVRRL